MTLNFVILNAFWIHIIFCAPYSVDTVFKYSENKMLELQTFLLVINSQYTEETFAGANIGEFGEK